MRFEFDKPTSDMEVFKGIAVFLKSDEIDYYDPIVTLKIEKGLVKINNGFHHYRLSIDEVNKIVMYNRNPNYDGSIDVIWYKDTDYETIWESEDD